MIEKKKNHLKAKKKQDLMEMCNVQGTITTLQNENILD